MMKGNTMRWIWVLPVVSGAIVTLCFLYCRYFWSPRPMTLTDPDTSIICWLYCYSMNKYWFYAGILFSSISITGGIMMLFKKSKARVVALTGGILIVPTGLINFIAYYFYKTNKGLD